MRLLITSAKGGGVGAAGETACAATANQGFAKRVGQAFSLPELLPRAARSRSEKGASIVVFTLVMAFVLIPIMGLGIDVAIQYWIKARLSSAVDSAALSAARSLNVGNTIASQTANAQSVGRQYFAANFPAGVLGTTVFGGQQVANSVSINVAAPSNYITVTATAQVTAPLYFLTVLRLTSGVISATSQTTRRNANVVLVLDRSGSMNNASNSCSALVSIVQNFANQFIDGRDQLALVTFSTAAELDYGPTLYFKTGTPTINTTIASLVCVGATSTEQGLSLAYKQIKAINEPGSLNVIVFFTDGQANSVYANFPVKTSADTRYDYVNTGTLTAYPKSPCVSSSPLKGLYTDFSRSINDTGSTGGVIDVVPTGISAGSPWPPAIVAPGCTFNQSGYYGSYNVYNGRGDVAYIPATDVDNNPTSGTGYKVPDTYPSGLGPYSGRIRADSPQAIRYSAMNVADNMAQIIRSDTTYNIVTYAIALSGNEPIPIDTDFMARIANALGASNYNPAQPVGQSIVASDNASLADAFNAIASQILRLSK